MKPIDAADVQRRIDMFKDQDVYLHLELTLGAYAARFDKTKHQASTFIKNATIRYSRGSIAGGGPFRVGLKTEQGWVYSEGLTHYEDRETDKLILAGHDGEGKLIVALMLSREAF